MGYFHLIEILTIQKSSEGKKEECSFISFLLYDRTTLLKELFHFSGQDGPEDGLWAPGAATELTTSTCSQHIFIDGFASTSEGANERE